MAKLKIDPRNGAPKKTKAALVHDGMHFHEAIDGQGQQQAWQRQTCGSHVAAGSSIHLLDHVALMANDRRAAA
jgi:hypothetical protein